MTTALNWPRIHTFPPRPFLLLAAIFVGAYAINQPVGWAEEVDWYRWRGPDLNGVSRETGWLGAWSKEGPPQLWKAAVGIGFSSVSVSQGRVYTIGHAGGQDTVFCFDATAGKLLWKHAYVCALDDKYYEGGPGSTPTVDGDRVYSLSKRGQLFCFDSASGRVLWQKNVMEELGVLKPEWGFAASPLVDANRLILNLGTAGTAIDKMTGKIMWTSGREAAGYATAVPWTGDGQRRALIFAGKALVAVKLQDGGEVWRLPWVTRWNINAADPILVGNQVFVSTFDQGGALLQMRAGPPAEVWRSKSMRNHFNGCVATKGYLYGVDGDTDRSTPPELRCLSLKDGQVQWSHKGLGLGSLMVADDKLIILSDKGELVIAEASPSAFKPLARAQVLGGKCWTVPVLSHGKIYCRNARGDLVCVDARGSRS
jgi:outer membrane protein assembly factor BamB